MWGDPNPCSGLGTSKNLTGPYLDADGKDLLGGGGTVVLVANDTWVGLGHNPVVQDGARTDWLLYHAIPKADPRLTNGVNRRPTPALLEQITWQGGWPTVNGGAGPSPDVQPVPMISAP